VFAKTQMQGVCGVDAVEEGSRRTPAAAGPDPSSTTTYHPPHVIHHHAYIIYHTCNPRLLRYERVLRDMASVMDLNIAMTRPTPSPGPLQRQSLALSRASPAEDLAAPLRPPCRPLLLATEGLVDTRPRNKQFHKQGSSLPWFPVVSVW